MPALGTPLSASAHIHDAIVSGPEGSPELMHGYTDSGHPLACAAALATLDVYRDQRLFERACSLAPVWEEALHGLRDLPYVVDTRNLGILGAVEIESASGEPGGRAATVFQHCY